jgi:hypothetical protein
LVLSVMCVPEVVERISHSPSLALRSELPLVGACEVPAP